MCKSFRRHKVYCFKVQILLHYIGYKCGRSVTWLTRLPVTEKIAGSNPVARAKLKQIGFGWSVLVSAASVPWDLNAGLSGGEGGRVVRSASMRRRLTKSRRSRKITVTRFKICL